MAVGPLCLADFVEIASKHAHWIRRETECGSVLVRSRRISHSLWLLQSRFAISQSLNCVFRSRVVGNEGFRQLAVCCDLKRVESSLATVYNEPLSDSCF